MNGDAITEDTLQSSLRDIRLPAEAVGGPLADVAAIVALACAVALMIGALMRLIGSPRARATRPAAALADLDALPDDQRRVALLHLLRTHAPERYAALRPSLYKPDPLDIDALQSEVARHV